MKNQLIFCPLGGSGEIGANMNLYSYGGHGYSLAIGNGHLQNWPERLHQWIIALDN